MNLIEVARPEHTSIGIGRGEAATWPTRKKVKKKARMAEREKSMAGGFWRGGKTICVNWVEPAAYEKDKK